MASEVQAVDYCLGDLEVPILVEKFQHALALHIFELIISHRARENFRIPQPLQRDYVTDVVHIEAGIQIRRIGEFLRKTGHFNEMLHQSDIPVF